MKKTSNNMAKQVVNKYNKPLQNVTNKPQRGDIFVANKGNQQYVSSCGVARIELFVIINVTEVYTTAN
jgi:hypothetical protein